MSEQQTIDHSVTPTLEIFAEVRKGYLPVINALVQAVIESPGSATTYLPLYDNGAGDWVLILYIMLFATDATLLPKETNLVKKRMR